MVIDPKTHVTLWNFTEYVRGAILLGNRDKNFDQAMTTIVNRMKILAVPLRLRRTRPGNRPRSYPLTELCAAAAM